MTRIGAKTAIVAALAMAFALSLASGCTSSDTPPLLERLLHRADQTQVCVENRRELALRVEVVDAVNRTEYGDVQMGPHQTECEYMSIPGRQLVHAEIKMTGVFRRIVPPAWTDMLTPGRGQTMRLRVGPDGLTRFAHSSRIR